MKTKTTVLFLLLVAVFSSSLGGLASAQGQTSSNVNLAYVTVQLFYPSEVAPGQAVTVSVQSTSKDNFEMDRLEVRIYIPIQNNLRQVATAMVTQGVMMTTSSEVTKEIQFTVPTDAPTTSLMAVVSETVRTLTSSYYYSYPYYGMYYEQNTTYPYNYYLSPGLSYMPSTDNVVVPLSYVQAANPQYTNLQSQYQTLQQQMNQAQSDNQKLQQDLKTAQDQLSQFKTQTDNAATANQQLASSQGLVQTLELGIAVLAILAGVLAFLLARRIPRKPAQPKSN